MSEKVLLQSENFKVVESTDEDGEENITIEGVAVPYEQESRNGVIYSEESIKETAETLEGRPFLFNHDPNQVLGHVSEATPGKRSLRFEANLNPEKEKVQDIRRGDVRTVSIQAMVEEAEEGEDNRVHVEEFLELSSAPIPGFDVAQANVTDEVIRIEEFAGVSEQERTTIIREPENITTGVQTRWDPQDMEDFPSKELYFDAHMVWHKENPENTEDVSFEVARPADNGDGLEVVYEALNSAYDLAETDDDLGADDVNSLRARLEELKEEYFPDEPALDADQSEEPEDDEDEDMDSPEEAEQKMADEDETVEDSPDESPESSEEPEEEEEKQEQDLEQKVDQILSMLEELVNDEADDEPDDMDDDEEESVEPSKQPAGTGGTTEDNPDINDAVEAFRATARGGE